MIAGQSPSEIFDSLANSSNIWDFERAVPPHMPDHLRPFVDVAIGTVFPDAPAVLHGPAASPVGA
jgi:hypothetical protein